MHWQIHTGYSPKTPKSWKCKILVNEKTIICKCKGGEKEQLILDKEFCKIIINHSKYGKTI